MSDIKEVSKLIELDLTNIPQKNQAKAKKEVGDFLLNEVLRYVGSSNSPVQGESKFVKLDKDYAKKEHNGNRNSILQLDGDLLSALKVKDAGANKIEIGIWGHEAPKADGHNQISGEAKAWAVKSEMPKRRFIPDEKQTFKTPIIKKINSILSDFRVDPIQFVDIHTDSATETPDETTLTIANLFEETEIEKLLLAELQKR